MKLYRHYKNKTYKYLGVARHSESLDEVVLYECLYENDFGKLWVRSREMFEEEILIEGQKQARFKGVELEIKLSHQLTKQDEEEIRLVDEDFVLDTTTTGLFVIKAYIDSQIVGFLLGLNGEPFRLSSAKIAVKKEFRNLGIASELLLEFEKYGRSKGCFEVVIHLSLVAREAQIVCLKLGYTIREIDEHLDLLLEKKIS